MPRTRLACHQRLRWDTGRLAGLRSDSTMQQEWCSRPIQRIYRDHQARRRDERNVTSSTGRRA